MNFRTAYLLLSVWLHLDVPKQLRLNSFKSPNHHLNPQGVRHILFPVSLNFTTFPPFAHDKTLGLFLDFPSPSLPTSSSQQERGVSSLLLLPDSGCRCLSPESLQQSTWSSSLGSCSSPTHLPTAHLILYTVAGIIFLKCNFDQVIAHLKTFSISVLPSG